MTSGIPPLPPVKPKTLFGVSKSTIQGTLSMLAIILLGVSTLQLPATLADPNSSHIWLWITFGASTAAGILKQIVALTQGDATT